MMFLSPVAVAHAASSCGRGWQLVRTPNPDERFNELSGVAAVSASDVWAVGSAGASPLIEHWDGSAWSIVSSPRIRGRLDAVDATSQRDAWAVGSGGGHVLIEHWDGVSWSVIDRSTPGSLTGVSALRSGFAMAVGTHEGAHEPQPLALRFTGSSWGPVATDTRGDPDPQAFAAVDVTSADRGWAVGTADLGFGGPTANHAQRWDGARFSTRPIPTPNEGFDELWDVDSLARDDVWAVGTASQPTFETTGLTDVEHWDGRVWHHVRSPNIRFRRYEESDNWLHGVAMVGADEVWAVGGVVAENFEMDAHIGPRMLALRWNGLRWKITANPSAPRVRSSSLEDVDALPDGHVWAAGWASGRFKERTLVVVRC
jgi:hypothetical protein